MDVPTCAHAVSIMLIIFDIGGNDKIGTHSEQLMIECNVGGLEAVIVMLKNQSWPHFYVGVVWQYMNKVVESQSYFIQQGRYYFIIKKRLRKKYFIIAV